jgi:hypothetical protein
LPKQPVKNAIPRSTKVTGGSLRLKLSLDALPVLGAVAVGSGLLVVVPFVKPVLGLQLLHEQHLLKLLCPLVRDVLRRLDGAHHREPVGSLLRRPLLRGRIGLLLRSRLKLLCRRPEPPRLRRFPLCPLGALAPSLGLGLAAGPLRGGGYIAIAFLPFFLPFIAIGMAAIAFIGGIPFLAFIGIFFDFAKVKLLAAVFGVRCVGHSVSPRSCAPGGDSASGPAL